MKYAAVGILCFLIALLLTACAQPGTADPEIGAALLKPFKTELQTALKTGLADGPATAIGICKNRAPQIATQQSINGVHMGRTSHRLRNPANQAPAWAQAVLDRYLVDSFDRTPTSVVISNRLHGYVEPILLQPVCVMCHGQDLAPEIATQIKAQYPMDKAVGFQPGDLRGVFWVEYPAPINRQ